MTKTLPVSGPLPLPVPLPSMRCNIRVVGASLQVDSRRGSNVFTIAGSVEADDEKPRLHLSLDERHLIIPLLNAMGTQVPMSAEQVFVLLQQVVAAEGYEAVAVGQNNTPDQVTVRLRRRLSTKREKVTTQGRTLSAAELLQLFGAQAMPSTVQKQAARSWDRDEEAFAPLTQDPVAPRDGVDPKGRKSSAGRRRGSRQR